MGVYHRWARNKVGRHNHSLLCGCTIELVKYSFTVHTVSEFMAYAVSIGFRIHGIGFWKLRGVACCPRIWSSNFYFILTVFN